MALSEIGLKRVEKAAKKFLERRRPPIQLRNQVDLGYKIKGQSIELFEIRRNFLDPKKKIEMHVAKATFVKKRAIWKIYWVRRDGKWHRYGPNPTADSIEEFFDIVENDEYGCFWG